MVTWKDHGFFPHLSAILDTFFLDLQMNEPGEHVEQAVTLQDLFPQVRRAIVPALWIGWISRSRFVALVQRKEVRGTASEASCHKDPFCVGGEMDKCSAFELEDCFSRVAVVLVLTDRLLDCLARKWIFELHS